MKQINSLSAGKGKQLNFLKEMTLYKFIIQMFSHIEIPMACMQLGIPQAILLESRPDWAFDGADKIVLPPAIGKDGPVYTETGN